MRSGDVRGSHIAARLPAPSERQRFSQTPERAKLCSGL